MSKCRLVFSWAIAFVALGLPTAPNATAEENKSAAVSKEYVDSIAKIRADLDTGRTMEALEKLGTTDTSMRGFEYEYLMARAKAVKGPGAAPDLIQTMARPQAESRYGVLNQTNRELVFICRDGGLVIHDLANHNSPPKRVAHPEGVAVWSGAFSHDGKTFVSGHENGDVLVWDAKDWKVRDRISLAADSPVRELVVGPDGSAFVGEGKGELELWSLAGDEPKRIAGVGERFNFGEGLAFSPTGHQLATGGMFNIKLFDAKTGMEIRSMRHASYTMGLEFSPDGKLIASAPRGNVNKFLAVFDVTKTEPEFNAGPFGHYIAGMAFTPDGSRIAATGCENVVRLFDSANGLVVLELPRKECGAKPAISRDGNLIGWSEPGGYRYIDLAAVSKSKN
jgi:WD40 repeat protein